MELVDLTVALFPGPTQLSVTFSTWGEPRNEVTFRVYIDHKVPSGIKGRHRHGHKFAFEAESKQTGLASLANRYMYSRCLIPRSPPFVCYSSVCVHNNNYSVTMIHCPLTDL